MYTFSKNERLCNPIQISSLFKIGKSFRVGMLMFKFSKLPINAEFQQEECCKTMVSVPKKIHKHAVTRNLLKRRMREAFRKNKVNLYENLNRTDTKIHLGIFYYGPQVVDSEIIQKNMIQGIEQLIKKLSANLPKI